MSTSSATEERFSVRSLLARPTPPPVAPEGVAEVVGWFSEECERLVAGVPAVARPLRLPKGRISDLLACERGAVASLGESELSEPLVCGRITDVLVAQHVTLGLTADIETDVRDAWEATAADDLTTWVDAADTDTRTRIWERAGLVGRRLTDGWGPIERSWWPRCQERITVDLGGGALLLSAQLDLVLGGVPTPHPWVVVEVKAGRGHDGHRADLGWYALLAALRYGRVPAWLATWTAGDDGLVPVPVTSGALEAAARRGLAALEGLVALVHGGVPSVRPHVGCSWCPELSRCEPGLRWRADREAADP